MGQGFDTLVKHAIEGIRAMPPRGGNPDLSDIEVARAVAYMANSGGASFKEPAAEAAPATVAAPAAGNAAAQKTVSAATPVAPVTTSAASAKPVPASTPKPAVVAAVTPAPTPAPAAATAGNSGKGEAVYKQTCVTCHAAGVAGAPKLGDKAAWTPRIAKGMEALYATALKGKGAMPAKGGNPALADADVKAAINYMVSQAK